MAFGMSVRLNAFISANSFTTSAESKAGGGPTSGFPSHGTSQAFQLPAFGALGGVLDTHFPGPVGMGTLDVWSNPSAFARSMTLAATARPSSRPAFTSLGYCTPAATRERAASSALVVNRCACWGMTYASTVAAAPATTACSDGYEGLRGVAITGTMEGSSSLGRGRLWAYFESHAATVASYIATLRRVTRRY